MKVEFMLLNLFYLLFVNEDMHRVRQAKLTTFFSQNLSEAGNSTTTHALD